MGQTPRPPRPAQPEEHQQYCPLALVVAVEGTHLPCGKGECAWWTDEDQGMCAIVRIARVIGIG